MRFLDKFIKRRLNYHKATLSVLLPTFAIILWIIYGVSISSLSDIVQTIVLPGGLMLLGIYVGTRKWN